MSLKLAVAMIAVATGLAGCADIGQVREDCKKSLEGENAAAAGDIDTRLKLADRCVDDNMSGRIAY